MAKCCVWDTVNTLGHLNGNKRIAAVREAVKKNRKEMLTGTATAGSKNASLDSASKIVDRKLFNYETLKIPSHYSASERLVVDWTEDRFLKFTELF